MNIVLDFIMKAKNLETDSDIYFKLRQLCSIDIDRANLKLGGYGKIVEIDESLYAKIKHGKGNIFSANRVKPQLIKLLIKGKDLKRPQVWTFGLVERRDLSRNGLCYLQVVPDREAPTLLGIIYEKCIEGTIIYSDCWSSYQKISKLKDFEHKTVNHTYNFLDPNSGIILN